LLNYEIEPRKNKDIKIEIKGESGFFLATVDSTFLITFYFNYWFYLVDDEKCSGTKQSSYDVWSS